MIEMAFLPLFFAMTGFAFLSITALMGIINGMACITFGGGVFVSIIRMAAFTAGFLMFTTQWKIGFAVIKFNFIPAGFGMTLITFFAEFFFMCIIFFMTAVTVSGGFPVFFIRFVAIAAFALLVFAF